MRRSPKRKPMKTISYNQATNEYNQRSEYDIVKDMESMYKFGVYQVPIMSFNYEINRRTLRNI